MLWFHDTNLQAYNSIINNGFKIINSTKVNRFGNGIYFSNIKDTSNYYGAYTIQAEANTSALELTIDQWNNIENSLIRKYGFHYQSHVHEYIQSLGYNALCIDFHDNYKELVIYDISIINIKNKVA